LIFIIPCSEKNCPIYCSLSKLYPLTCVLPGDKDGIYMKLYKTRENEIFYYHLKNGNKRFMYRYRYYDLLGKRKERKKSGFKSMKEAQRELIKLKASLLEKNLLQTDKYDLNVSQWIDVWYKTYSNNWAISTK